MKQPRKNSSTSSTANPTLKDMINLFNKLCQLGKSRDFKLSLKDLEGFKKSLNTDNPDVIRLIDKLIINFNDIGEGREYITRDDIKNAAKNDLLKFDTPLPKQPEKAKEAKEKKPVKPFKDPPYFEFQDPKTITREQLQGPIDIRI